MTTALRFLAVALLAAVAGCTSDGDAASSCAGSVLYENREYIPAPEVGFTVGERLGTAEIPECDDTPSDPGVAVPEGTTGAYAVQGREPAEAIAVGDTPAGAKLMKVG
ncbi:MULTISPECIES: DUF6281 family protein [unclassified Streptomyces]|uniref:DUF6281 family protein n=1 Tax=unclassified Streptomyces TaxID=2593676 RepID=UPI0036EF3656